MSRSYVNYLTVTHKFTRAIAQAGLTPPLHVKADGQLHRFSSNGQRGDDAGYYVLHLDGLPAGLFGCWRLGLSQSWRAEPKQALTPEQEKAHRDSLKAMVRERAAEKVRRHAEARERAVVLWSTAQPASPRHRYLVAKGIQPHGVRTDRGQLVLPVRSTSGELHSLQFISPTGGKRFLTGGRVSGGYFSIGKPEGTVCIAEGFATAASIHEATGHAVAVAFNAGNLAPVAQALHTRFPELRLIVCADDDRSEGNPGLTHARAAAETVGGLLAIPDFGRKRPARASDFNDLARLRGPEAVREAIARAAPLHRESFPVAYRCLNDVPGRPIRWLWPGRIARGKVSLIAGNPGTGKSQLAAALAAIVTRGGRWPVEASPCPRGNVVILSAEDDAEDTLRPRLEAAGADLARVYILDAVWDTGAGKHDATRRPFNLSTDLERLGELLTRLTEVALVVIDPVSAYLGGTDSHRNAEVRALLAPLGELAAQHSTAIVCISHLAKASYGQALMKIIGSVAFVAAARAGFVVLRDAGDPARRLFLPVKNNLGDDRTGCAFRLEAHTLPGGIETSRIAWEPELVTISADEAMAAGDDEEGSALADAKGFLRMLLAEGPVPAKQVKREADEAGHGWTTVRRAQATLGVQAIRRGGLGKAGVWVWQLQDGPAKVDEPPGEAEESLSL